MQPLALVIENDVGTRKLLDVLLTRSGLEVDLVPTGSDALILLEHARYDLLLIDLLLPGTSGIQVLEWISRERPRLLGKSVVLSSAPDRHLQTVRQRWPRVRVIRKPFELGEIIETSMAIAARREERVPSAGESFCRYSVRAGAKAGIVLQKKEHTLDLLLSFGYGPSDLEPYFPLALDAPMPICKAVRSAGPVWLASLAMAAAEYPQLARVFEKNESRALAAVPLMRGSDAVGGVGWTFREPRLFGENEQQIFTAIAAGLVEGFPAGQSRAAAGAPDTP